MPHGQAKDEKPNSKPKTSLQLLSVSDWLLVTELMEQVPGVTMTDIAKKHGVSKGTVTKTVNRFESAVGIRLFGRSTRRLILTEVGEQLLPAFITLRDAMSNLREQVKRAKETELDEPSSWINTQLKLAMSERVQLLSTAVLIRRQCENVTPNLATVFALNVKLVEAGWVTVDELYGVLAHIDAPWKASQRLRNLPADKVISGASLSPVDKQVIWTPDVRMQFVKQVATLLDLKIKQSQRQQ